jgi:hypothetical protein
MSEQWPEKQFVEGRISKTGALLAQNRVLCCSVLFNGSGTSIQSSSAGFEFLPLLILASL